MSADPPNSSSLPARSRPILSELAKQTTEEDLWDLDEEASDTATPGNPADEETAEKPAAGIPGPPPEPPAPAEKKTSPSTAAKTKPVVIEARLEKPASKKRSAARKEPERSKVADAFDNLDSDTPTAPTTKAPPAPAPASPSPDTETPKPAAEIPAGGLQDEIVSPKPAPVPAPGPKWHANRREVIGLGIFSFVLLFAAIWGLAGFFGHLHFADSGEPKVKFPVKGARAVIAAADSFWREPIREGPNRDAARSGTAFIPVVEISLSPESGSGALRLLFRNDKGAPVGDTITRTFSGGKFDTTGTERIECASSDGFSESGEFNSHQTGYSGRWSVLVLEGPGPDAPAREFSTLLELPLSTLLR